MSNVLWLECEQLAISSVDRKTEQGEVDCCRRDPMVVAPILRTCLLVVIYKPFVAGIEESKGIIFVGPQPTT